MKNWDHSINQHVLVYQRKDIIIILLYFCRSNKKVYGFCFFWGGPPIYIYIYRERETEKEIETDKQRDKDKVWFGFFV